MYKGFKIVFLFLIISYFSFAQSYTSYFTGDVTDVTTQTSAVTVLMGGASEHDNAMRWFLQHSGGGDVVVLRATGSDGYNAYMYSQLGVAVNSVETIVCNNASASYDPYVIQQVMNAEALWFAGGDQWDYVSYWNNTPLDTAINYLINVKHVPVGGTSAGMAIQGHVVFTAQSGTVTSASAVANPYNTDMTLLKDDFILNPWLQNVVTDTHYDNPDRRGRHTAFLARITQDYGVRAFGIACNEYVAVCIDTNGTASVYGDYPNYQEFAFFLQGNCVQPSTPETCIAGQPLTWDRNQQAVKVYKVPGTQNGTNYFQLSDWTTGSGGTWQDWYVNNGVFQVNSTALAPGCALSVGQDDVEQNVASVYPNPARDVLTVNFENGKDNSYQLVDVNGRRISAQSGLENTGSICIKNLADGFYFLYLSNGAEVIRKKIIIQH